jgi:diguanylate cyclase (GGDEF)-like protein/PAS domain S-box-containing protein
MAVGRCRFYLPRRHVIMNDDPPRIDEHDDGAVPAIEPQPIVATRAIPALREIEPSFSDVVRDMDLASIVIDPDGRIAFCSDYLRRLTGWTLEEVIGRNYSEIFLRVGRVDARAHSAIPIVDAPARWTRDDEVFTRTGERRLIRWNIVELRSGAGEELWTACIGEDITERKRAEARIAYLHRVNATLSGINTLIVRVRDRDELFRHACRIAVEHGGFLLAIIGIIDRAGSRLATVVVEGKDKRAVAAAEGLLSASDGALTTMIKQAIGERKPIVANDSRNDARVAFRAMHIEFDCSSMAVMPLMVADEAVGVLVLYAAEMEFFHDEEMRLLTEMAGDISFAIDHIEKQERFDYLCYYDALTGLANRGLFVDRLAQQMRASGGGYRLALLMIDLERFKSINDTLGRAAGDELLRQVANWLAQTVGDAGLLTRFGGDQFGMVLPQVKRGEDVAHTVERTLDALLSHPFHLNGAVFRVAAKVGVALCPDDGADANILCNHAEAALKKAKGSGDRYLFYAQRMTRAVAGRLALENQLRRAYDRKEFVLHYQPKVNFRTGHVTGAEALIRWNDPAAGLVPPGKFIPVLEETGLIYEVGRWAMSQAIEDYLRWSGAGLAPVPIAVNVSPLQLQHRDFVSAVKQAIDVDAQAASALELEITESMIMQDIKHNIANLNEIRALGVGIAIDDFGTGFSSLSYLAKLPLDTLKIDRSFVNEVDAGPEGLAIVSTIIGLAHSLNLNVVAEGVETDEQWRVLRSLNCDEMQGYLFSKPLAAALFEKRYLQKKRD